jgi:hypothetical protein
VMLLWTKHSRHRNGLSTRLMHEGIQFLVDDSYVVSGTSATECVVDNFLPAKSGGRAMDNLVQLQILRKTLEEKSEQKGT